MKKGGLATAFEQIFGMEFQLACRLQTLTDPKTVLDSSVNLI